MFAVLQIPVTYSKSGGGRQRSIMEKHESFRAQVGFCSGLAGSLDNVQPISSLSVYYYGVRKVHSIAAEKRCMLRIG